MDVCALRGYRSTIPLWARGWLLSKEHVTVLGWTSPSVIELTDCGLGHTGSLP